MLEAPRHGVEWGEFPITIRCRAARSSHKARALSSLHIDRMAYLGQSLSVERPVNQPATRMHMITSLR